MQLPSKRSNFSYGSNQFVNWAAVCVCLGIGPAMIYCGITGYDKNGGFLIPMGACFALFGVSAFKVWFKTHRPISIDEEAVSALAFSRPWKTIPWPEVKKIERVTKLYVDPLTGSRMGFEFIISGSSDRIIISDEIFQLPWLLSDLDVYSQNYKIPLIACDKRSDALHKIRATVRDPQERKKQLKEGIKTPLASLKE